MLELSAKHSHLTPAPPPRGTTPAPPRRGTTPPTPPRGTGPWGTPPNPPPRGTTQGAPPLPTALPHRPGPLPCPPPCPLRSSSTHHLPTSQRFIHAPQRCIHAPRVSSKARRRQGRPQSHVRRSPYLLPLVLTPRPAAAQPHVRRTPRRTAPPHGPAPHHALPHAPPLRSACRPHCAPRRLQIGRAGRAGRRAVQLHAARRLSGQAVHQGVQAEQGAGPVQDLPLLELQLVQEMTVAAEAEPASTAPSACAGGARLTRRVNAEPLIELLSPRTTNSDHHVPYVNVECAYIYCVTSTVACVLPWELVRT